ARPSARVNLAAPSVSGAAPHLELDAIQGLARAVDQLEQVSARRRLPETTRAGSAEVDAVHAPARRPGRVLRLQQQPLARGWHVGTAREARAPSRRADARPGRRQ